MEHELQGETVNPRGFGGKEDPDQGAEKASPEEQQDYEMLTIRARKMMFGDGKDQILKMMGSSESPAKGIGQAASMLVKSLISSSKEQGREIGPDAAINAGSYIASELNDLGKSNGIFQYDSPQDEEKELKDAVLWGVKLYGDGMIEGGELTSEMTDLAKKTVVESINEEAKNGKLPKKNEMAQAVGDAVQQPQGIISGAMQSGA